jgi:predicted ArsR family transcriptional regulator
VKETKDWNFITNHGLVLLYISRHPQCTTREMASIISATERTVHRVLVDLEREGYVRRQRTGKGNIYRINREHGLKHELTRDSVVGDLLYLLSPKRKRKRRTDSHARYLGKDEDQPRSEVRRESWQTSVR